MNVPGFGDLAADEARHLHLTIEAMARLCDRAAFLGDPRRRGAVAAPSNATPKNCAAASIEHARPASDIRPGGCRRAKATTPRIFPSSTAGNAVANTTTPFSYRVGLIAEQPASSSTTAARYFAKPGTPNAYGLTGRDANAPGPGKRPPLQVSPTILIRTARRSSSPARPAAAASSRRCCK